jgi:Ornithine carbamoyltransferase
MALTDNAFFMHCLPVRRNMIVTDEVIDEPPLPGHPGSRQSRRQRPDRFEDVT